MQTTQQLVVCDGTVYLMGMCPLAEKWFAEVKLIGTSMWQGSNDNYQLSLSYYGSKVTINKLVTITTHHEKEVMNISVIAHIVR